jgi:microcompartment protein CcmL/EutN
VEALSILEFGSIASGILALDALVKEARVEILSVRVVEPGKYLILFTGGIADVDAGLKRARTVRPDDLLDQLFIPGVHPDVVSALRLGDTGQCGPCGESLGVIETLTIAAAIDAADRAAKGAEVRIIQIRIGPQMGGKATVKMTGRVGEVEAAVGYAEEAAAERGGIGRRTIIANPHAELLPFLNE